MRSLIACCAALLTAVSLIATPVTQAQTDPSPGVGETSVDQRFLGRYIGTAENTTQRAHGRMSIDIERSTKKGYVQLKMKAWGGLMGEGTLMVRFQLAVSLMQPVQFPNLD